MDTFASGVADRVQEAIEAAGHTRLGIAKATGIPRTTLIRKLDGHTPFTVADLGRIAQAIGAEPADFIQGLAA